MKWDLGRANKYGGAGGANSGHVIGRGKIGVHQNLCKSKMKIPTPLPPFLS